MTYWTWRPPGLYKAWYPLISIVRPKVPWAERGKFSVWRITGPKYRFVAGKWFTPSNVYRVESLCSQIGTLFHWAASIPPRGIFNWGVPDVPGYVMSFRPRHVRHTNNALFDPKNVIMGPKWACFAISFVLISNTYRGPTPKSHTKSHPDPNPVLQHALTGTPQFSPWQSVQNMAF